MIRFRNYRRRCSGFERRFYNDSVIGTPSDFPNAKFVVGSGTLDLLAHGGGYLYPKELFNHDELPFDRTFELKPVDEEAKTKAATQQMEHKWEKLDGFELDVVDFFGGWECVYC